MNIYIYMCVYIYIHMFSVFLTHCHHKSLVGMIFPGSFLVWFFRWYLLAKCFFAGSSWSTWLHCSRCREGPDGFMAVEPGSWSCEDVRWSKPAQEAAEMPGYRRFAILIGSWLTVKVKLPMYWHNDSLFKLNDLKNCTESMLTEFQAVNGCAIWTADRMAECHGLRLFGGWLDELLHVQNMAMSMPCLRSWPSKLIDFLVVCRMTVCNFISRRLLGIPALFF